MERLYLFPVLLVLLFGTPAFADYQKGGNAADRGDYATAFKEWKPLVDRGDASGQNGLGWLYLNGYGVPQNYKIAFDLFTLSAEQGFAKAQDNLGLMYRDGLGTAQDYKAAIKWYNLAAEQGNAKAQDHLGLMYYIGLGVTQDFIRAHMWWTIAASKGNENAAGERTSIQSLMTSAEIEEAQKLTRECVAKDYRDC